MDGLDDECVIWCQAAYVERSTELDAISTSRPRGEAGCKRLGAEFEDDGLAQGSSVPGSIF
jgi:hypothetical protein